MCTQYLGRNISIVHSGGIWSSDDNIVHENVLVYKGSQTFFPTDVGTYKLLLHITHISLLIVLYLVVAGVIKHHKSFITKLRKNSRPLSSLNNISLSYTYCSCRHYESKTGSQINISGEIQQIVRRVHG